MAGEPCYYDVLGLARSASDTDIKKQYRRLAVQYHPDKNVGNEAQAADMFKLVAEAYEVLSDADKRQTYDLYGREGVRVHEEAENSGGPRPDPQRAYRHHYGGFDPMHDRAFQHAQEIFESFFGGSDPFMSFSPFGSAFGRQSGSNRRASGFDMALGGFGGLGGSGLFGRDPFAGLDEDFFGSSTGFDRVSNGPQFRGSGASSSSTHISLGGGPGSTSRSSRTVTHIGPDGRRRTRTETTITHPDGRSETQVNDHEDEVPIGSRLTGGGRHHDSAGRLGYDVSPQYYTQQQQMPQRVQNQQSIPSYRRASSTTSTSSRNSRSGRL